MFKVKIGDFELDTIIGKGHKGTVVTIVDRKSKLLLAKPVKRKAAVLVSNAIIQLLKPYIKYTNARQWQRVRLLSENCKTTRNQCLLCQSVFVMGTRFKRAYQWFA